MLSKHTTDLERLVRNENSPINKKFNRAILL